MGQSAGTGQQPRRFAEGGSTSTVVDFGALAAPDSAVFVPGAIAAGMYGRPSPQREAREIYRPAYYDSLGDTEPAARFQMQMPTFNRQGDPMYTKSPVVQPIVNEVTGELFQRTGHQPYRPTYEAAGLAATPQYQMQMPMFSRPDRSVNTRLQRPIPYMTQTYLDKIKADAEAAAAAAQIYDDYSGGG